MEKGDTQLCRTCLASNVKFYKLEELIPSTIRNYDLRRDMSFFDCLNFCTHLNNWPEFPKYICEECSHALQIAFIFIQNALKAHNILKQRLGSNGNAVMKQETNSPKNAELEIMRFRCKMCNEKVQTKKALKEHIKLHLDFIIYCCQMCDFDCKKRSQLSDHYTTAHNIEASAGQLKPYMQAQTGMESKVEENTKNEKEGSFTEEFLTTSEQRQKEQEEAENLLQELEKKLLEEKILKQQEIENSNNAVSDSNNALNYSINVGTSVADTIDTISTKNFNNDMSVGSEFVVLSDGTVQKVIGSDVLIEYINQDASITALQNKNLELQNVTVQMDTNDVNFDSIQFDDIIEEAPTDLGIVSSNVQTSSVPGKSQTRHSTVLSSLQDKLTIKNADTDPNSKKLRCKICFCTFQSQLDLKTHMLRHDEIPHFFCDQCSFYTFFKKDLTQHYMMRHNVQPSQRQLQPINNPDHDPPMAAAPHVGRAVYSCDLCLYETSVCVSLRRHYVNEHCIEASEVQLRPTIDNTDVDIKASSEISRTVKIVNRDLEDNLGCTICNTSCVSLQKYKEHMKLHEDKNIKSDELKYQQAKEYINTTSSLEENIFNVNSIDVLSMNDAVPQIIACEQTIEETSNFDLNGGEIFEDFDENNESIDDDEDADLGELFLTSEDDLDDLLEEHGIDEKGHVKTKPAPQLRAYCVHCNKRFFSQYHFENHMFMHRGLAPFRCEMCTNLYNTKRAIIRHYKAVHKTIPTRDMIQAKGDKVHIDKVSIANLNVDGVKRCTLMCAKCPFESKSNDGNSLNNLLFHLKSSHGISDDNYILQKLPFECPRCIRSYESKASLLRHLERSHSMASIIQQGDRKTIQKKPSTSISSITPNKAASSRSGIVESSSLKQLSANVQYKTIEEDGSENIKASITSLDSNFFQNGLANPVRESEEKQNKEIIKYFECSICQGKYKSQLLLKHHLKRHVERKFICDICPKSFIVKTELRRHKLLHLGQKTGEKPFKCDMCHKQFGYQHHLKRHKDVAHFGKRYFCSYPSCGKSFTTTSQVNVHRLSHTGNMPYKCKICSRFFSKREPFRRHNFKVHSIRLTDMEISEIYRENMGHTNPHDLIVALDNGQMLRRFDVENITSSSTKIAFPETV